MNTEITLPMPDLKNALSGLNKFVGRKTTLPVLSHIKVTRKSDGLVTLQGTDLDAHATFTLAGSQPGPAVELLVPLEQLNSALKCSAGTKQDVALVCEGKTTKLRYFLGGNWMEQRRFHLRTHSLIDGYGVGSGRYRSSVAWLGKYSSDSFFISYFIHQFIIKNQRQWKDDDGCCISYIADPPRLGTFAFRPVSGT
jgi:hypothetical protein